MNLLNNKLLKAGLPKSGDFDGDGSVTMADVLSIVQFANDMISLTPAQFLALDIDGNGNVTMVDVLMLVRKLG